MYEGAAFHHVMAMPIVQEMLETQFKALVGEVVDTAGVSDKAKKNAESEDDQQPSDQSKGKGP